MILIPLPITKRCPLLIWIGPKLLKFPLRNKLAGLPALPPVTKISPLLVVVPLTDKEAPFPVIVSFLPST